MPTFAYNVSGEYAMLRAAAANGWLDWEKEPAGDPDRLPSAPAPTASLTYGAIAAAKLLGR